MVSAPIFRASRKTKPASPAVARDCTIKPAELLGVGYDLTHWLTTYASYSTIFNPQNLRDANGRTLDPEEGKSWELGLKGEWLEGRLNASAAVFWSG